MIHTAQDVFEWLPKLHRSVIERVVLERAGLSIETPSDQAEDLTLADVLGGDSNHSLLRAVLTEWWLEVSTTDELLALIESTDTREIELACVLCAEASSHIIDDPRVAECRRVRFSWVRGEASDEQRERAIAGAWAATMAAARDDKRDAARAAARISARDALAASTSAVAWAAAKAAARAEVSNGEWSAARDNAKYVAKTALAAPLRLLYPDPCAINVAVGLANWDKAVEAARSAL